MLWVQRFVPTGPILLGLDDTIERRRGKRIQTKGIYRDPVRSSHSHFVKASGLRSRESDATGPSAVGCSRLGFTVLHRSGGERTLWAETPEAS